MALRLQIISRHRQGLGERGAMDFGHNGGTIGRSLESDWVLPDGQRYLSSRHASIDYRSGSYYIVDTSTNGVYVNDAEQPVGRGNPQRLFSGDRIRIGEYEMSVEVIDEDDTRETLANDRHVDPVEQAKRVPPPDPTRADMVAPHEITAVGIEMLISDEVEIGQIQRIAKANAASLRLADEPAPANHAPTAAPPTPKRAEPPPVSAAARLARTMTESPNSVSVAPPAPAPVAPPPAAPKPAAPKAEAGTPAPGLVNTSPALEAFFRGAGLQPRKVDERQTAEILHRLGQVLREVVVGCNDNLHLRSEQKQALRVPTTTIQPQNNNPLKFSASVDEALNNLLFRDSAEYLSAVEAVRETFTDIKQHQQHVLAAVRAAVDGFLAKLDPEELENKVSNGNPKGLLHAANKLKYWDLFKDLYLVVTSHQPGTFPPQFLEELSRAYELEASRAVPATANPRRAKAG
jgi:type VI secretion system FHA domain protein